MIYNHNFGDVLNHAAFPMVIMYFSVFKTLLHNPDMLTLEQFETFCEKHNYTVPEETSFLAKMSSTSDVLGNLHANLVVGINHKGSELLSSSDPSEMEMAEKPN